MKVTIESYKVGSYAVSFADNSNTTKTPVVEATDKGVLKLLDELRLTNRIKTIVGIEKDSKPMSCFVKWFAEVVEDALSEEGLIVGMRENSDGEVKFYKFGENLERLMLEVKDND